MELPSSSCHHLVKSSSGHIGLAEEPPGQRKEKRENITGIVNEFYVK
jgi:hypothetical protein